MFEGLAVAPDQGRGVQANRKKSDGLLGAGVHDLVLGSSNGEQR